MQIDLPPPLMTFEPGSFAQHTITERKPQIIQQVIEENVYPADIVGALETFRNEISQGLIQPLTEQAPDLAAWNNEWAAYQAKTWLELPWYFAETFFYRRLLEAVRYFEPGPWRAHDPFGIQKQRQVEGAVAWLGKNWDQMAEVEPNAKFEMLLHSSLWGNRADLSNLSIQVQASGGLATEQERHHILIDHTDQVRAWLAAGLERVDLICDNVGYELLFDLMLTDYILSQGWSGQVVLHLKEHPFFVSDAMPPDLLETIALLQKLPEARELGWRLGEHLATEQLGFKENNFWTSCLMFRELPLALSSDLAKSNLVIIKGDVNYRRLLDDAHWPHTARMEEIAAYFPAPFVTLRTLKGEIVVGLEPGQAEALAAQDPTWLINGKRGIIQFAS
jgi:uncharacterized protein with ATP-grasp and redox domains